MTPDRAHRPRLLVAGGAALATLALLGVGITAAAFLLGRRRLNGRSRRFRGSRLDGRHDHGARRGRRVLANTSAGARFQSDGKSPGPTTSAPTRSSGTTRRTGRNEITGKPFDDVADTYVKSGPGRIGSQLPEVPLPRLHGRDASGTSSRGRPTSAYLGFLGPVIRARSATRSRSSSATRARSRRASTRTASSTRRTARARPYNDGTSGPDKADDAVPTGRPAHLRLEGARSAPARGPDDGSSVMWMYHSHTDEVGDTYAGLMGPMEITAPRHGPGRRQPEGRRPRDLRALLGDERERRARSSRQNLHRFARDALSARPATTTSSTSRT